MSDPAETVSGQAAAGSEMDASLGALVSRLTTDLGTLTRQELALAKSELRDEAKKAGGAAGMFGASGVAALLVAIFASVAATWALAETMHLAWAALIVTGIWAVVAAVLYAIGRRRLRAVHPVPNQTVDSLKEDSKWLTTRNS